MRSVGPGQPGLRQLAAESDDGAAEPAADVEHVSSGAVRAMRAARLSWTSAFSLDIIVVEPQPPTLDHAVVAAGVDPAGHR